MITAVQELGKWVLQQESKETLDVLIEPISETNYPHVFLVEIENDQWKVEMEECEEGESHKYLYRRGASNGPNFSPTTIVTDLAKTFDKKFMAWFDKVIKQKANFSEPDISYIQNIYNIIHKNRDDIYRTLETKLSETNGGCVLTLKINGHYLKEDPVFVSLFTRLVQEKDSEVSAKDQVCSVCGHRQDVVMAGSPAFKFYTNDKPGFISGEFDKELAWRNHPVCMDCNLCLQEGKRFLENRLKFRFYGLEYHLIPEFIFGEPDTRDEVTEILRSGNKYKTLHSQQQIENSLADEEDILDALQEADDDVLFHLLFLRKVQSAERILMVVEDVIPSRLRKIFEAKKQVEQRFPLQEGPSPYRRYHLGRIRTFFNKSDDNKRQSDLDKYFLEITSAVFRGQPLDIRFLTRFFMQEIRKHVAGTSEREGEGSDTDKIFHVVRDALMNVIFFDELKILETGEGNFVPSKHFEGIFELYGPHLDRPEKKALFLLGALTQMLLKKQQYERNSQPFLKQLKGLKMQEKDFHGLLPKVQDKLQQYNAFDAKKQLLAEEISDFFLRAGTGWKLSVDEMNFCFVSGMNLVHHIENILYGKREETTEGEEK
ncbi:CRISPR-associated protein Csh1 [Caldalkalibacillus uzonensis]|uniref:CRISPR-associated protein Csh1 n=1 Tax=Caldalkalibacillus uzonensis TaxID=353224 RepID=A0ABU0CWK8_9BACI|nr:TIGR02556 family CRISPR-associated protein [Caldalkalibacillus uzonensis]MDQ0340796.1 CRISPR-associated protein Csh1 [Caldalkalibacillus uzonensis]